MNSELVSSSGDEDQGSIDPFLFHLALAGYKVLGRQAGNQAKKRAISLN